MLDGYRPALFPTTNPPVSVTLRILNLEVILNENTGLGKGVSELNKC